LRRCTSGASRRKTLRGITVAAAAFAWVGALREEKMRKAICGLATVFGAALAGFLIAAPADAQVPQPVGPQADDIRSCLCLKQSVDADSAAVGGQQRSLDQGQRELAQADADLERMRASLNVDDPAQVAQFRQQLERRDALFRRVNGEMVPAVAAAVQRYNGRVAEYNARCSNRPFDSVLMSQIQASPFSCPPQ
jgi:hypothetical protein